MASKITKASKRRLSLFGTISIIAVFYFIFSLVYSSYSIYNLTKEKNRLNDLYIELQEKAEDLKLDIEKLQDPNYLADYARETYLYTKDDEYVLQIEEIIETNEKIDNLTNNINKNYIIFGLICALILIFIYIISKSNKKSQKKKGTIK